MNCRSCGHHEVGEVIDLGRMPLVNNLLREPDESCPRWPLKVVFCRSCSLAQLTESPPPDAMFRDYCYYSSQSRTMVEHGRTLVERFVRPGQRVLEIASNDGYLLRHAIEVGATVLGIDPAISVAEQANAAGVPTRCDYFNRRTAAEIRASFGPAETIFANNVLAHVPDPNEIAAGIRAVLAPQGIAHIEVPYLARLIESAAFDTIYHEHYSYFSVCSLQALFRRHGLTITNIEEIDIHGGSLHVQIATEGDDSRAEAWCERERGLGLFNDAYYEDFTERVERLRVALEAAIDECVSVAGFGAAAKAVVLLNHFDIDIDRIPWVADVSPHKQDRFIPGTGQPIVSPARLIEAMPEACVIFPWNISDEIRRRNQAYIHAGGRFIVPPELGQIASRAQPERTHQGE